MTTATKKRSKKAQAAEDQAQGLSKMEAAPEASENRVPDAAASPECPKTDENIPENIPAEAPENGASGANPETASPPQPAAPLPGESGQNGASPPAAEVIVKDLETVLEEESDDDYIASLEVKAHAFDEAVHANAKASTAFQAWKKAHEDATAKKKAYEAAVHELRQVIHEAAHPEETPLFNKPKDAATAPAAPGQPSQAVPSTTDDDAWRNVRLEEALPDLKPTVIKKLNDAQLYTMGELANWTAEDGGRRRITDIAGIGGSTAGKIEEATTAFWERWAKNRPAVDTQSQSIDSQVSSDLSTDKAKIAAEAAAFRATPIPWFGLLEAVPEDAKKFATIGDLQKYANEAGVLINSVLAGELGLNDAGVAAIEAWMSEQLDKVVDVATAPAPDAADPLREFLATPVPWGDFDEAPADITKLATIADLENQAASVGLGMIDALKNAGMTPEGAQTVVDWLEGCRSRIGGAA